MEVEWTAHRTTELHTSVADATVIQMCIRAHHDMKSSQTNPKVP